MAMAAEINNLKRQLKLAPKLAAVAEGEDKDDKKDGQKKQRCNKKDRSNKRNQKKDEAWKKVPPKEGESKEKKHGDYTFHWCKHHMAWMVHKPDACLLGKQRKEEQKPAFCANSATVAAATATATVNPHYAAMLATLGNLAQDE
jgi:hypothetical protein